MRSRKKTFRLVSTILFNFTALLFWASCKDIIFNNPLDPDASVEAVKIIKTMSTSLGGKGDICFDGEKFWKIDSSGNLSAFDIESGIIIRDLSAVPGTGLTFFKGKLYLCQGENILYVLDSLSGDILDRLSTTGLYPAYLTASSESLILFDQRSSGFFDYDPDSGTSHRLFQVSGITIGGIELYQDGLLVTDMNTDLIYHFSLSGAVFNVFRSPASGVGGITVDSLDYIYLLTLDGKVYKISLP